MRDASKCDGTIMIMSRLILLNRFYTIQNSYSCGLVLSRQSTAQTNQLAPDVSPADFVAFHQ